MKQEKFCTQTSHDDEVEYVVRKVAEWIAAGDVIEEHAYQCVQAVVMGFDMIIHSGKDMTLEHWCDVYHTRLKMQETMDPKEFAAKKRMLHSARRRYLRSRA